MNKNFRKKTSILTLAFYLFTQTGMSTEGLAASVTPSFFAKEVKALESFDINLNSDLGTIESISSGNSSGVRTIVHIQEPHGNFEAQKKIEMMLAELKTKYGFDLILLEGTPFKLYPEMIRFFPDQMDKTSEVLDKLAEKGWLSGPELFLAKDKSVQAYGIENLSAYRENTEAFVAVQNAKDKTSQFLKSLDEQISRLAAAKLNADLRQYLNRKEGFDRKIVGIEEWLNYLKSEALEVLQLDLENPKNQLDWPSLLRIFMLKRFEREINPEILETEKERFLNLLKKEARIQGALYSRIENLLKLEISRNKLSDPETEMLIEEMVSALPQDFNYESFQNLNRFIGHLILQSEIKADELFGEMEKLSGKILDELSKTEAEKKIVSLLLDYSLLQKLFALELTPKDLDRFEADRFSPSHLMRQMKGDWKQVPELDELYRRSLDFYRWARKRDELMLKNVESRFQQTGKNKAVVITGGFHAEPFKNYFESRQINYALISPKLSTANGRDTYIAHMLESFVGPKASTLQRFPAATTPRVLAARAGFSRNAFAGAVRQELNLAASYGKERGELRANSKALQAVIDSVKRKITAEVQRFGVPGRSLEAYLPWLRSLQTKGILPNDILFEVDPMQRDMFFIRNKDEAKRIHWNHMVGTEDEIAQYALQETSDIAFMRANGVDKLSLDDLLELKLFQVLTLREQYRVLALLQSQGLISEELVIQFQALPDSPHQISISKKGTSDKQDPVILRAFTGAPEIAVRISAIVDTITNILSRSELRQQQALELKHVNDVQTKDGVRIPYKLTFQLGNKQVVLEMQDRARQGLAASNSHDYTAEYTVRVENQYKGTVQISVKNQTEKGTGKETKAVKQPEIVINVSDRDVEKELSAWLGPIKLWTKEGVESVAAESVVSKQSGRDTAALVSGGKLLINGFLTVTLSRIPAQGAFADLFFTSSRDGVQIRKNGDVYTLNSYDTNPTTVTDVTIGQPVVVTYAGKTFTLMPSEIKAGFQSQVQFSLSPAQNVVELRPELRMVLETHTGMLADIEPIESMQFGAYALTQNSLQRRIVEVLSAQPKALAIAVLRSREQRLTSIGNVRWFVLPAQSEERTPLIIETINGLLREIPGDAFNIQGATFSVAVNYQDLLRSGLQQAGSESGISGLMLLIYPSSGTDFQIKPERRPTKTPSNEKPIPGQTIKAGAAKKTDLVGNRSELRKPRLKAGEVAVGFGVPKRQMTGLIPQVKKGPAVVDVSGLRSREEALGIIRDNQKKHGVWKTTVYQRGADIAGSSSDLLPWPIKLTKPNAKNLKDFPSTTVITSEFPIEFTIELAEDPNTVEYHFIEDVVNPETGEVTGHKESKRIHHKDQFKLVKKKDTEGREYEALPGSIGEKNTAQSDVAAYIFGHKLGYWGVKVTARVVRPVSKGGGFGSSGATNAFLVRAASMLSGANLNKAEILAETVHIENQINYTMKNGKLVVGTHGVADGYTGGQEAASGLFDGVVQFTWTTGAKQKNGSAKYPYSFFVRKLIDDPKRLAEFGDHLVIVQPGLEYIDGKAQDNRSAWLVNTMWGMELEYDPVGAKLNAEKLPIANQGAEGLIAGGEKGWKKTVDGLKRHKEIRDELVRRFLHIAMGYDPETSQKLTEAELIKKYPFAPIFQKMFKNDATLQMYHKRFGEDLRNISLYSHTAKKLYDAVNRFAEKKGIHAVAFQPGAGGMGTSSILFFSDPKALREFLSLTIHELGLVEADHPDANSTLQELTDKRVNQVLSGKGKNMLRGFLRFNIGKPIEDVNLPEGLMQPAEPPRVIYNQKTRRMRPYPAEKRSEMRKDITQTTQVIRSQKLNLVPLTKQLLREKGDQVFALLNTIPANVIWNKQKHIDAAIDNLDEYDPDLSYAVLDEAGNMIAFAMNGQKQSPYYEPQAKSVYINFMAVEESFQGTGVAQWITHHILATAKKSGHEFAHWRTRADTEQSLKFYDRAGAERVTTTEPDAGADIPNIKHVEYVGKFDAMLPKLSEQFNARMTVTNIEDGIKAAKWSDAVKVFFNGTFLKANGLAMGVAVVTNESVLTPHFHPHGEYYYIADDGGGAELQIENDKVALNTGDTVYIPAGKVHTVKATGQNPVRILFAYKGEYTRDFPDAERLAAISNPQTVEKDILGVMEAASLWGILINHFDDLSVERWIKKSSDKEQSSIRGVSNDTIIYIAKGQGKFKVGDQTMEVKAGDGFVISGGENWSVTSGESDLEFVTLQINENRSELRKGVVTSAVSSASEIVSRVFLGLLIPARILKSASRAALEAVLGQLTGATAQEEKVNAVLESLPTLRGLFESASQSRAVSKIVDYWEASQMRESLSDLAAIWMLLRAQPKLQYAIVTVATPAELTRLRSELREFGLKQLGLNPFELRNFSLVAVSSSRGVLGAVNQNLKGREAAGIVTSDSVLLGRIPKASNRVRVQITQAGNHVPVTLLLAHRLDELTVRYLQIVQDREMLAGEIGAKLRAELRRLKAILTAA